MWLHARVVEKGGRRIELVFWMCGDTKKSSLEKCFRINKQQFVQSYAILVCLVYLQNVLRIDLKEGPYSSFRSSIGPLPQVNTIQCNKTRTIHLMQLQAGNCWDEVGCWRNGGLGGILSVGKEMTSDRGILSVGKGRCRGSTQY